MTVVRGWLLLALLLLAVPLLPPTQAQPPPDQALYNFQITADHGDRADVPVNGLVNLPVTFHDLSRDNTVIVPAPGLPSATVLFHQVTWEVIPQVTDPGWTVFSPSALFTVAGESRTVDVPFQVVAQAKNAFYPITLVAHVRVQDGGTYDVNTTLVGFSLGPGSFSALVPRSYQLHPRDIVDVPVKLTNLAIGPRSFDMNVTDNPCHMPVATANNNLVPGKSDSFYNVTIQAPEGKLYYFSESCSIAIAVSPTGNHAIVQKVFISVQVSGLYINPLWIFQLIFLAILLFFLLLFLRRRKERVEEEILGKPQKPWTIPVEALYLRALKQKDERAWYVVRHYLMEDEYRSSLLWYKSYKHSTKGGRKKEGLVLRQERGYERWKRAWTRSIARPVKQAGRYEAMLQRKLDRKARKAQRKQMGKYRAVTAKMKKAHAAQVERAGKVYAKEAAKAQKKGLPAPRRTAVPEPDYPDEPALVPIPLSTHRWAKKAGKFRAKMVRKQGDLEVKFEKADARRLRKVRRKVGKLAKKLDDPDFVAEHPLLQG